jgi:alkaline phosphatase
LLSVKPVIVTVEAELDTMAHDEEPLLTQRTSTEQSIDQAEEDALLTGQHVEREKRRPFGRCMQAGVIAWATVATAAVLVLAILLQSANGHKVSVSPPKGKRNLIMMVSDGMGATSLSLTRSFKQNAEGLPFSYELVVDSHLIGQSRTRSTSSLVTDSAAGATAFSCGLKSYNGAISVLDDHTPCGTVLEAAKKAGYMTGLVVTTRITDATPACFASHVNMRSEEDLIARQLIGENPLGRVVDLIIGGGRCHFLPNTTDGSCRADELDIVAKAKDAGWHYASSRADFDALRGGESVDFPLLALVANEDIPYEIDRRTLNDKYPSLDEMAKTAMKALSEATKNSDTGFFLMIEGSRIDHAGHANDPAAQVHEVLSYDQTFASVLDFLEKDTTPGVMVSTSDHETGGLAVARRKFKSVARALLIETEIHPEYPEYRWFPEVLANVSHSSEALAQQYFQYRTANPKKNMTAYLEDVVHESLGVFNVSPEELQTMADNPDLAAYTFADIVSRRAQTGWSTHGHSGKFYASVNAIANSSGADVNIYTSDKNAAASLIGNHENTDIGKFLREYLEVDVEPITKKLKEAWTALDSVDAQGNTISWLGAVPVLGERLDGQDHLDHYQGDFRKYKRSWMY